MIERGRLGGIGDEAAAEGEGQVAVQAALGFGFVELRSVDGVAIADLSRDAVEALAKTMTALGIEAGPLASRIGNWSRVVGTSFAEDRAEFARLARLAPILGSRGIRVMTYCNDGRPEADYARAVLDQFGSLGAAAREHGLLLLVENCTGWAQSDPDRYLAVEAAAGVDVTRLLFDVGNPVYYGYDGFAYLRALASRVGHVHVKDARRTADGVIFTLPGEGEAQVLDCIRHLLDSGYAGRFSLEPHLAMIPHLARTGTPDARNRSYREYAGHFLGLLAGRAAETTSR